MKKDFVDVFDENEEKLFSKKLTELMKQKKVTQKQLAKELNIRPQTVSSYVKARTIPNCIIIKRISQFFNVSADFMVGLSEIKTNDINARSIHEITGISEENVEQILKMKNDGTIYKLEKFLDFIKYESSSSIR